MLDIVIPVLQQYCKLNEQMDQRQYYSALKTLEQLEHTLLPPVKGYIFSELLRKEIPKIRKSIEDKSNAELTVSAEEFERYGNHVIVYTIRTFWPRFARVLSSLEK